jgi:hypothetical protein
MNRQSLIGVVVAFAAIMVAPTVASADHRFGTDRGSRYSGGGHGGGSGWHGGGGSRSFWNVSVGFGSGGYHGNGWYGTALSFGRAPTYYRGGYSRYYSSPAYCAPTYYAPTYSYCAPPVVYAPAPRVVYVAPVYYTSPVYTSSYYYSSGGYYCGR